MAEPLAWGQNTGCIIPHGSCGEWIQAQQQRLIYSLLFVKLLVHLATSR